MTKATIWLALVASATLLVNCNTSSPSAPLVAQAAENRDPVEFKGAALLLSDEAKQGLLQIVRSYSSDFADDYVMISDGPPFSLEAGDQTWGRASGKAPKARYWLVEVYPPPPPAGFSWIGGGAWMLIDMDDLKVVDAVRFQ